MLGLCRVNLSVPARLGHVWGSLLGTGQTRVIRPYPLSSSRAHLQREHGDKRAWEYYMSNRVGIAPSADRLKIVVRDATILVAAGALGLGLSGCTANVGVTAPTSGNTTQVGRPANDQGANGGGGGANSNIDPRVPEVAERVRAAGGCEKSSIYDSLSKADKSYVVGNAHEIQSAGLHRMVFTVALDAALDAAGTTYRTYYCTDDEGSLIVKHYTDRTVSDINDPKRSMFVIYSMEGGVWAASAPIDEKTFHDSMIGEKYNK